MSLRWLYLHRLKGFCFLNQVSSVIRRAELSVRDFKKRRGCNRRRAVVREGMERESATHPLVDGINGVNDDGS